jgi:hypothetical protein
MHIMRTKMISRFEFPNKPDCICNEQAKTFSTNMICIERKKNIFTKNRLAKD